jgi:intracellular sulfur oxidation DsrE/DsrF family protein
MLLEASGSAFREGMSMRASVLLSALLVSATAASAQQRTTMGPVVPSFGPVFEVSPDFVSSSDIDYKVAFDVSQGSSPERANTSLTTVARFLNMHGQAGIPRDRIGAAVVIHGSAVMDVLNAQAYRERHQADNPNADLIRELLKAGVEVVVCGQSAASRGVEKGHLMDGVQMALSAMTAFVILQEEGYVVNPW